MKGYYTLLGIGSKSDVPNILTHGKMHKSISVKIQENRQGGTPLIHNCCMTVCVDEAGEYIDFTNTRFKENLGIVRIQ
ncbi:hypothetical protein Cpap_1507 [Ruminiclostridium papyrosolvens DSM 2782]|uniref:Uncharacterized protein n=1 Tax=Ruminiclostridium papyrosolvens DSM 2782 TaxID=588581 RepID=F1TEE9_9FIRM|nr:hypothetical protein [Ruminiclostridium papyrosolvens]EGD47115.1 hypothetical protein Cpap_1507 [Ruminiclostridium papyrosolvens DSM 2782]WES36058.1 hypothetical protein P0092_08870 [Ruminiclostridium papyrosolvens DSM 2782]WES36156.1 hypothetical protein P0092_09370 [Ruminiclostridium papyrosolvens DSM 2782]